MVLKCLKFSCSVDRQREEMVTVNFGFKTFVMLVMTFVILDVTNDMLRYCVHDQF
jgi:hypothetical protein